MFILLTLYVIAMILYIVMIYELVKLKDLSFGNILITVILGLALSFMTFIIVMAV